MIVKLQRHFSSVEFRQVRRRRSVVVDRSFSDRRSVADRLSQKLDSSTAKIWRQKASSRTTSQLLEQWDPDEPVFPDLRSRIRFPPTRMRCWTIRRRQWRSCRPRPHTTCTKCRRWTNGTTWYRKIDTLPKSISLDDKKWFKINDTYMHEHKYESYSTYKYWTNEGQPLK